MSSRRSIHISVLLALFAFASAAPAAVPFSSHNETENGPPAKDAAPVREAQWRSHFVRWSEEAYNDSSNAQVRLNPFSCPIRTAAAVLAPLRPLAQVLSRRLQNVHACRPPLIKIQVLLCIWLR